MERWLRIRTGRLALTLVLVASQLVASAAWSVRVEVKSSEGEAVARARVVLMPEDPEVPEQEARTDADGVAVVPARPGRYRVEVRSEDFVSESVPVEVDESDTASAAVTTRPVRPWMLHNPGGVLGAFTVGPLYAGQWGDLELASGENERVSIDGGPFTDLGPTSKGREFTTDSHLTGLELALGLPRFRLCDEHDLDVYPAIRLLGGYVDATLESKDPANPSSDFELDGDGSLFGAGADVVVASPASGFYGNLAYEFQRQDLDLDRRPCPSAMTLGCRSDAESLYTSHWVAARFGYARSLVGVHAGIGYSFAAYANEMTIERLLPTTPTPTRVVNRIDQDLKRERIQGVAGIDARIGPVFGRAETRFDDEDIAVMVHVVWGFGFVDWFPW